MACLQKVKTRREMRRHAREIDKPAIMRTSSSETSVVGNKY
jgi:hypothetical protein